MNRWTALFLTVASGAVGLLASGLPIWQAVAVVALVTVMCTVCAAMDVADHDDKPAPDVEPLAGLDAGVLARGYADIRDVCPDAIPAGQELADALRTSLTDLDDVTLGRVMLHLGSAMEHVLQCPVCEPYRVVDVLAAGLDLTALEWQSAVES